MPRHGSGGEHGIGGNSGQGLEDVDKFFGNAGFNSEDLTANRAGKLSDHQHPWFVYKVYTLDQRDNYLGVLAIGLIFLAGFLLVTNPNGGCLCTGLVAAAGLASYLYFVGRNWPGYQNFLYVAHSGGKVLSDEGRFHIDRDEYHSQIGFGSVTVEFDLLYVTAFNEGERYRFFYEQTARELLSAEWLGKDDLA